jgi:hypothetical protein
VIGPLREWSARRGRDEMGAALFDALTKVFADDASRRQFVGTAGLGALTALLGGLGFSRVAAACAAIEMAGMSKHNEEGIW